MCHRTCDLCENTAVIHDTLRRAGVVKVRHLCRAHGLKVWREALPGMTAPAKPKNPVLHSLTGNAGKLSHRRRDATPPQ